MFLLLRIVSISSMGDVFSLCKQTHVLERNGFALETQVFWLMICSVRVSHKVDTKNFTQHLYKFKVIKLLLGDVCSSWLSARTVSAGTLHLRLHTKQVSAEYELQIWWHFICKTMLAKFVYLYGNKMGSPCTCCQRTKTSLT